MRVLVTGAAGMLGSRMMKVLGTRHEVCGTDIVSSGEIKAGDITQADEMHSLLGSIRPDAVVHCAAYTAVDDCEAHPEVAHAVNAQGTLNIAVASESVGAEVFYISTDYVFDGTKEGAYVEEDPTCPISVYGKSKLEGEEAVRQNCTRWYVGRTQWLYGEGGPNFAETMIRMAGEQEQLRVVDDQKGSPTYTGDLALQVAALLEGGAHGLYHISNGGETTWCGFARAVLERAGITDVEVIPCTTEEYPRPAARPANSVMSNLLLDESVGNLMRPWEGALDEYMENRTP